MMPTPGPDSLAKRAGNCIVETMPRSGTHLDLGPRLHVFTAAGLPQPPDAHGIPMDSRADSCSTGTSPIPWPVSFRRPWNMASRARHSISTLCPGS